MKGLLDTQAFLWFSFNDSRLGNRALDVMRDGGNDFLLSAVSVWEIAIKHARGRLPELPEPLGEYIPQRLTYFGFAELAIETRHALKIASLPDHHRDPFDRMLVAQAQVEGLPILTSDPQIARYDVETIW